MKISLDWLNTYLDRPIAADDLEDLLTNAGFPIDARDPVGDADTCLDVEVTNNRGDCLSHLGIAREVAAATGCRVVWPQVNAATDPSVAVDQCATVENREPEGCPLYTARVIRGVRVGPSPDWLVRRLESVGLRSVNNVVDVTNFVLMETGQPLHAFDLAKLDGARVVVRRAADGEPFAAIDGSAHKLAADMLVIADAKRPVAVAGVMGGLDSEVSGDTRDVLIESAVFDPLAVRRAARRLKLASDSSYRFERGVDPAGVDRASARAVALILELVGGELATGVIQVGDAAAAPKVVTLRPERCRSLLGIDVPTPRMVELLSRLGFNPEPVTTGGEEQVRCTVPSHRLDVDREVDLIEEVARLHGFDSIGVEEKIHVVVRPEGAPVRARRVLRQVLVAHGYHEAITDSFLSRRRGEPFLPSGHAPAEVEDDRRKHEPMLRPSLIPSLMTCRKANQDAGNNDVRLFETAHVWSHAGGQIHERSRLALLGDAPDPQAALRAVRGAIEELVTHLAGDATHLGVEPATRDPFSPYAHLTLGEADLGWIGLPGPALLGLFDLQQRVVAAELDLTTLTAAYPPQRSVGELPRFPGIERDLSVVVTEAVSWAQIAEQVTLTNPEACEQLQFVGVYRGKPIDRGHKSVTLRLRFRDTTRTLRHEDVDPQVERVLAALCDRLGAELRA